jgi:hypothetical protein
MCEPLKAAVWGRGDPGYTRPGHTGTWTALLFERSIGLDLEDVETPRRSAYASMLPHRDNSSCAWSPTDGESRPWRTAVNVKLLLPPRQSRGTSPWGLERLRQACLSQDSVSRMTTPNSLGTGKLRRVIGLYQISWLPFPWRTRMHPAARSRSRSARSNCGAIRQRQVQLRATH